MRSTARAGDIGAYRNSAPYFASLLLLAIPAFWPTYLYVDKVERDFHVHLHGMSLFLWSVTLIVQPWLIGTGRVKWHRRVGKASFGLAPIVVASTILLAHHRAAKELSFDQLYFLYVQLALLTLFAIAYVQAIRFRRSGGIHARYMVCTALTLVDPILARLEYNLFGIDIPVSQVITYGLIDAILVHLWMRDRALGNGISVFPAMLGVFLALEIPTFLLPGLPVWESLANAFARLPLP